MADNFLKSFMRASWHWACSLTMALRHMPRFVKAAVKAKPVSYDTAKARISTCYGCAKLDLITGQCRECCCFVRLKVQWADEACPDGKWDE